MQAVSNVEMVTSNTKKKLYLFSVKKLLLVKEELKSSLSTPRRCKIMAPLILTLGNRCR